jgi:outer membrane protein OmpA-like peptidoglycan-associated protein
MGGYDLFYAIKDSSANKYKKVYNVGFPLNSSGNDLYVKFENNPGECIVSKHDSSGFTASDLFLVQFDKFSKFRLIPVSGTVTINGNKVSPQQKYSLSIVDKNINDTVNDFTLDDHGNFNVNLYPGNFVININGTDIAQKQEIIIPEDVEDTNYFVNADILTKTQQPVKEEVLNIPSAKKIPLSSQPETKDTSAINQPETKKTATLNLPESKDLVKLALSDTCYFMDILFDFNQFGITESEKIKLLGLITKLIQCQVTHITVSGYTDALGKSEYNNYLSEKRAQEVKRFFVNHGISKDILYTEAKGSQNFIAINKNTDGTDNPTGRSFNRRVELRIDSDSHKIIFIHKNNVPLKLMFKID